MACYISSNQNRVYAAVEPQYGEVQVSGARERLAAIKLSARQESERPERRDKTGGRSYPGLPATVRKRTSFELQTYMTSWPDQAAEPAYGPLFQAALGGAPEFFPGATAGDGCSGATLRFAAPHDLSAGQAVTFGGEIRFVAAVAGSMSVQLNAPFSMTPSAGSPLGATVTYRPATRLKSASILDYWSPETAVHRLLCGAAVNTLRISVNGDFHTFEFRGAAMDLVDSSSFSAGQGQLASFPDEPEGAEANYSIIPGHLGQAWLGVAPDRFPTVTGAEFVLDNDLDLRAREFGSEFPRCISAGTRAVTMELSLYEQDDEATQALYQAARQRSPIPVMFQLGQQPGQLFGVYMKSVMPEVPEFDDSDTRLQWSFKNCRAIGTMDDELVVAFG